MEIAKILKGKITYKFLKYCIVGTITTLEGWTIVYVFTEFVGTHYIVSSMIGTPIVMVSAFTLNYLWTWGKNEDTEIKWLGNILRRLRIAK